ncbi:methylthioribose kinase [Bacillus salitolerans]|uniref:Methylthioribose kinase n=1 Tax=Bacillus salitolerans TaxID=1437434 RepID=A0ABW4LLA2_9BACI
MIQRFIELGEGYSDIYELMELGKSNPHRIKQMLALHTTINEKKYVSIAIVLQPAKEGKFMPIYICREGIPIDSQRYQLFRSLSEEVNKKLISFEIKPSSAFSEKELYYQYLLGILRLHHILPSL